LVREWEGSVNKHFKYGEKGILLNWLKEIQIFIDPHQNYSTWG
jgi:hypothetical protein